MLASNNAEMIWAGRARPYGIISAPILYGNRLVMKRAGHAEKSWIDILPRLLVAIMERDKASRPQARTLK